MKIRKKTEKIEIKNVQFAIVGVTGIGKTSLATTCDNPIILDFDKRVGATPYRADSVEINSWSGIRGGDLKEELKGYQTICVDTLGRMQECIIRYLESTNTYRDPRKMYGDLLNECKWFTGVLKALNKDILWLLHSKEVEKKGEYSLDANSVGSFWATLMNECDVVCYYKYGKKVRYLDFTGEDSSICKSPELANERVPNLTTNPYFLNEVFLKVKTSLNSNVKEKAEILKEVSEFMDLVNTFSEAKDFNSFMPKFEEIKEPVLSQIKSYFHSKSKELNLEFVKDFGVYK